MAMAKIPSGAKQVKCPQCGESFSPLDAIPNFTTLVDQTITTENNTSPSDVGSQAAQDSTSPRQVRFKFNGCGTDYFGIWIVNTLLKIITLGIYSPWAKVRKRSYFYGCTTLEGKNFDYLASPIALLKGWLLGAVLFLLYMFGSQFSPVLNLVLGLLIFTLFPWVIVRSRMFNNRNSAHRNIRFSFYPDYKGAYVVYLGLVLLTPLTLGILMPYVIYRQKLFHVENSSYGTTPFRFSAQAGDYYKLCFRGLGIVILVAVCVGILFAIIASGLGAAGGSLFVVTLPLCLLVGYMAAALYFYVAITNLTWSNIRLKRHRFVSDLKILEILWVFLSNGVAIIFSIGLLTPWATVRLARYRLEHLSLIVTGSLDEFEAASRPEVSAIAEEIGDIFDMDFGL
jgi:uncharacterized membrane protein YjgN (DUF898 family)